MLITYISSFIASGMDWIRYFSLMFSMHCSLCQVWTEGVICCEGSRWTLNGVGGDGEGRFGWQREGRGKAC